MVFFRCALTACCCFKVILSQFISCNCLRNAGSLIIPFALFQEISFTPLRIATHSETICTGSGGVANDLDCYLFKLFNNSRFIKGKKEGKESNRPYLGDVRFIQFSKGQSSRVQGRLRFGQRLFGFRLFLVNDLSLYFYRLPLLLAELLFLHRDIRTFSYRGQQLLAIPRLVGYFYSLHG